MAWQYDGIIWRWDEMRQRLSGTASLCLWLGTFRSIRGLRDEESQDIYLVAWSKNTASRSRKRSTSSADHQWHLHPHMLSSAFPNAVEPPPASSPFLHKYKIFLTAAACSSCTCILFYAVNHTMEAREQIKAYEAWRNVSRSMCTMQQFSGWNITPQFTIPLLEHHSGLILSNSLPTESSG